MWKKRAEQGTSEWRYRRWAVLFSMLLAVGLRFFRIDVQSFWDDEVATFRAAALTLRQIWTDIPIIDSNPPLIYTMLHFWRKFGESELGMRSMAALFGVAAIPVAYLALRRLIGDLRAAAAVLLLAVNPLAIYCGQETRYNTMVTFFVLLAVYSFIALIEEARWRNFFLLIISAALAIYSHYFAFFIIAALAVILAAHFGRVWKIFKQDTPVLRWLAMLAFYSRSAAIRTRALITAAFLVEGLKSHIRNLLWASLGLLIAGLTFVPFLKFFTVQLLRGVHWREPLSVVEVLQRIAIWLFVGHSVTAEPTYLNPLTWFNWSKTGNAGYSWYWLMLPLIVVAIYGMAHPVVGRKRMTLSILVLVPLGGVLVVSRLTPIFDPRYMLPFVPFVLGALAAGLVDLAQSRTRWLAAVLGLWLLTFTGFSLKDYYYSPRFWRQDWRGLAADLSQKAEPDAEILFYNFYTSLAFLHYWEKQPSRVPVQYLYVLEERFGPLDVKRRRIDTLLDGLTQDRRRVWLVDYHGYMDDPYDDVRQGLTHRKYVQLSNKCWMRGLWQYCLEHWSMREEDMLAALSDNVSFIGSGAPSPFQLIDGWYPGQGVPRWIGKEARIRFAKGSGPLRFYLKFFANLDYLGGPLSVQILVDDAEIGRISLDKNQMAEWWSDPLVLPSSNGPTVTLTIRPDRAFIPDRVRGDGDKSEKSLLVEQVSVSRALE